MAREKEAMSSSVASEKTAIDSNASEEGAKQAVTDCPQDGEEFNGSTYYFECYCKDIKYPKLEEIIKPRGIKYVSLGIKEMGNEVTHLDPAERAKNRYTCGAMLDWDEDNSLKFKSVNACYDFVTGVAREAKTSVEVITNPLYYGCGERIQKTINK